MTWLRAARPGGAQRVRCDVCGRTALSRFDRRAALPPAWSATAVRGRHLCPRCAVRLGYRGAR